MNEISFLYKNYRENFINKGQILLILKRIKMNKIVPIGFILLFMIGSLPVCAMDDSVDQRQELTEGALRLNFRYASQSFSPTVDSLTKIEVALGRGIDASGDVIISLREHIYGKDIDSVSVSTDKIDVFPNFTWVEVDFDDLIITPGRRYFIVVTYPNWVGGSSDTDYIEWMIGWDNPYERGANAYNKFIFWWPFWLQIKTVTDFSFRTYGI